MLNNWAQFHSLLLWQRLFDVHSMEYLGERVEYCSFLAAFVLFLLLGKRHHFLIFRVYRKVATDLIVERYNINKMESQHHLTLHNVTMTMRASNIKQILLAPAKLKRLQPLSPSIPWFTSFMPSILIYLKLE